MGEVWSDPEFLAVLVIAPLVAVGLGLWLRRAVARARHATDPVPGLGVALASALDGDLVGAESVLRARVGAGDRSPDLMIGLVAVLRARGRGEQAGRLVERWARGGRAAWLSALRVRIALDTGDLARAAELAMESEVAPGLAVSALARAGRFEEALALFHRRVPKKAREARTEATLLAGAAAQAAQAGGTRSSRRRLRRALAVEPEATLVAAVSATLSGRATERRRAVEVLDRRAPQLLGGQGLPDPIRRARERAAAGEDTREAGLRALRAHLDTSPEDWPVRCEYWRWLLDVAQPSDWRSEVEELLGIFEGRRAEGVPLYGCERCGHRSAEVVFVCPRCDAFDRSHPVVEGMPVSGAGIAVTGAAVRGILDPICGIKPEEAPWSPG